MYRHFDKMRIQNAAVGQRRRYTNLDRFDCNSSLTGRSSTLAFVTTAHPARGRSVSLPTPAMMMSAASTISTADLCSERVALRLRSQSFESARTGYRNQRFPKFERVGKALAVDGIATFMIERARFPCFIDRVFPLYAWLDSRYIRSQAQRS
jgi:hypothetical protein